MSVPTKTLLTHLGIGAVVGAIAGGLIEYLATGGASGLWPGVAGTVGALVALLYTQLATSALSEPSSAQPSSIQPVVRYTAAEILASMKDLTSVQQDSMLQRYVGELIEVEGTVDNVLSLGGEYRLEMRLDEGGAIYAHSPDPKVASLSRKERVKISGKVDSASGSLVRITMLDMGPPSREVKRRTSEQRLELGDSRPSATNERPIYSAQDILGDLGGLSTTAARKARLEELYAGEVVEFEGTVDDVEPTPWMGDDCYTVRLESSSTAVSATFRGTTEARRLRANDLVRVRGKVSSASRTVLYLNHTKIIKIERHSEH